MIGFFTITLCVLVVVLAQSCPPIGSSQSDINYQPHPTNASKYIVCNNGEPQEMDCPDKLVWNQEALTCDWPKGNPKTLVIIVGLVTGSYAILCPLLADVDLTVHLPHPTNCSRFLTCVHGIPTEQECPKGLQWNAASGVCDYPFSANCVDFDETSILFDVTSLENGICMSEQEECPQGNQSEEPLVFFKDTDCRNFHICIGGEKLSMSCPPSTFWKREQCICGATPDEECVALDRLITLPPSTPLTDEPSGRVRRSVTYESTEAETVVVSEIITEALIEEQGIGDQEIIIQPAPVESSAIIPTLSLFAAAGIAFTL
ncbi:uncharacterized protein LOC129719836 [Wyeomyia smithii]|uniref:uncharacterized protein LOC129719836 n=1 Tax=Wyeomyia smithii TaxID=174621 RepID=UPI002467C03E|nr:uncharacterized protein LOC129719836 [Wyeomyia smithii]